MAELWRHRNFLLTLPLMQIRARHGGTVLGGFWTVLSPLMLGGAFYLVFGVILGARADVDNYVTFLMIGVFIFTYTSACVIRGSKTMTSNLNIIRTVNMPRAAFPIASVLTETLVHLPAVAILLVVGLSTGEPIAWSWLLLLPALVLQAMFSLGLALWLARVSVHVPDFRNVLPFAMRIWLYFSGVFFTVSRVPEGLARTLFELNPLYTFIALNRQILLGMPTPTWYWWAAAAWASVGLVSGFVFFWQRESSYGSQ